MSDLQSLAKQKAAAEMQRRVAALPGEIEATKRQLAAKGLLLSGAMLNRVLAICEAATEAQRATVIAEYRWAVNQALFASQSWVERLVVEATNSLEPLHAEAERHLQKACALVGKPELVARLLSDLEPTEKAAVNDIALALRSCFAERRRGLVRSIPSVLPRLLSRIFGGGTG
jgi:hypothetical protein